MREEPKRTRFSEQTERQSRNASRNRRKQEQELEEERRQQEDLRRTQEFNRRRKAAENDEDVDMNDTPPTDDEQPGPGPSTLAQRKPHDTRYDNIKPYSDVARPKDDMNESEKYELALARSLINVPYNMWTEEQKRAAERQVEAAKRIEQVFAMSRNAGNQQQQPAQQQPPMAGSYNASAAGYSTQYHYGAPAAAPQAYSQPQWSGYGNSQQQQQHYFGLQPNLMRTPTNVRFEGPSRYPTVLPPSAMPHQPLQQVPTPRGQPPIVDLTRPPPPPPPPANK